MDQSEPSPSQALPDWLTEDYFRSLLRRKSPGGDETIKNVTVDFADAERIHGKMVRAVVDVASASGTSSHSYIVKAPGPGRFSATPASANMYRTEALVLGKIIPAMEHVLEAVSPGRFDQLAPRLVDYGLDENQFIITEDLSAQGFANVPRQKGMDLEHSLAYAKHLGAFHGASVGILDRFESDITSIPLLVDLEERKNLYEFIETSLKGVVSVLESWEDGSPHVDKVRQLAATIPQRLAQANRRRESRLKVLCHGDMFVNNILFRYGESGNVSGVRLVDFQLSRVGSFADDLSGFMVSAVSDEVLADNWEEVVEAYRGTLNEVLHLLGLSGRSLSQEAVRDELREQRAVAQFAAFHILPYTRDPNAIDLRGNRDPFSLPAYQRLLRVLLPRFDALGWLDEFEGSLELSALPVSFFLDRRFFGFRKQRLTDSLDDIDLESFLKRKLIKTTTHQATFRDIVETKPSLPIVCESSGVKCLGGGDFQTTPSTTKDLKMETLFLGRSVPYTEETLKIPTRENSTPSQFCNHGDRSVFSDTEDVLGQVLRSVPHWKTFDIKHCLSFIRLLAMVFLLFILIKTPSKISQYPVFIQDHKVLSKNVRADLVECLVPKHNFFPPTRETKSSGVYIPKIQFELINHFTGYLSKNESTVEDLQRKANSLPKQNRTKFDLSLHVTHCGVAESTDKLITKENILNNRDYTILPPILHYIYMTPISVNLTY